MKSKAIFFGVLLFCSKFVDSIPHSEDLRRPRASPLSTWPANKNAREQYLDTGFAKNRNGNSAFKPENTKDYNTNQVKYHYNDYNQNPSSLLSGEDNLANYDSSADKSRLSYLPRDGLDNSLYRHQNRRLQKQYASFAPSAVNERPVVTSLQEPFRHPVHYNRISDTKYPTRVNYPLVGDSGHPKDVLDSVPTSGSSGSVPYINDNEGYGKISKTTSKTIPIRSQRHQSFEVPAEVAYEIPSDADHSENTKYVNDNILLSDLSKTAPKTNYDDSSQIISATDLNHANTRTTNLQNNINEPPVGTSNILSEKSRYADNNRVDTEWRNIVRDGTYNSAPAIRTDNFRDKSGSLYNYKSDLGLKNPTPNYTYTKSPLVPTNPVLDNSRYNNYDDSVPQNGSNIPTSFNYTNLDQNVYNPISSGIDDYNLMKIVSNSKVKELLAANKTFPYIVIHSNGTVQYLDDIDYKTQYSKYGLVHAKDDFLDGADDDKEDDEVNTTTVPVAFDLSPLNVNQQADDNSKQLLSYENQLNDDYYSDLLPQYGKQSDNDDYSIQYENQPANDKNVKSTLLVPSRYDDNPTLTTLSSTVPDYNLLPTPLVQDTPSDTKIPLQSTTNSPPVITTLYPGSTAKDEIITISPIELVTDNVSDSPPVTTTTASRVKIPGILDTDKQDAWNDTRSSSTDSSILDKLQANSTTTLSPRRIHHYYSVTDINDDKVIKFVGNKNSQNNDKTKNQVNNGKNDTRTAVYNTRTNSDVPAESDDYSPVNLTPSVQNDVDTGDASTLGDYTSDFEKSETDVKIKIGTANDSEDDTLIISIEVSERTDDADSFSNDKAVLISINTDDDSDDVTNTLRTDDCKKYQTNNNENKGKNVEIDMANMKEDPTIWIRTTNQNLIDKLRSKNDTEFDVVYFLDMSRQLIIERDTKTTIFCNSTVVIETTKTTYASKDDPTPTIEKTKKIMKFEDYEQ